jgi:molecular chaperone HtpG
MKRILELNPAHPLITALRALTEKGADHPKVREYAELLYDQAALTAGLAIDDPLQFAKRLSQLMAVEAASLSTPASTNG